MLLTAKALGHDLEPVSTAFRECRSAQYSILSSQGPLNVCGYSPAWPVRNAGAISVARSLSLNIAAGNFILFCRSDMLSLTL